MIEMNFEDYKLDLDNADQILSSRLILVRGLPGSGKSSFANSIHNILTYNDKRSVVVEADQFFTFNNEYHWDKQFIHFSHVSCLNRTELAIRNGFQVIVANTFTEYWETVRYTDLVKDHEVSMVRMISEYESIHEVPEATISRMRNRFYKDARDICV